MKKLAVLIALILILSPSALALTITGADIEHPLFPWGAYTLELSLFTDDPAEVSYEPTPAEGTLVMARLTGRSGQIALNDIQAGTGQFELRDAAGDALEPLAWRVRGVAFSADGNFSTNDLQDGFELIFLLPDGATPGGASLLVGDPASSERVIVRLPEGSGEAATGAAADADATPEPDADATPESAAEATPEPVEEETLEPAADETPEPVEEETLEPVADETPEPVEEETLEPVVDETPESAAEATPEPTADPFPAAARLLGDLLSAQAESASDPWTKAILQSGPQGILYEDGALRFKLRSFDPKLKELGDYEADKAGYLTRFMENAGGYSVQCALPVTLADSEFTASDKDVKALVKAIGKAAATAKSAFNDKRVRIALSDYLFDAGSAGALGYDDSEKVLVPFFATQIKQTLSVKEGPFALKLTSTGADGEALVEKAGQATLQKLARQEGANRMSAEEIGDALLGELGAQAAAFRKKDAKAREMILNIDELLGDLESGYAGAEYEDYVSVYTNAYETQLGDLTQKIAALPDYPSQDFPKSGLLSGSKRGTKVILKAPADGYGRYVQMRGVENDEAVVSAFIRSGGSTSVRVPKGMYTILLASGEIWYGEEHLFGDGGSYQRTEEVEILGSSYYHTFTLGGVTDGNTAAYGADPSDFQ